MVATVATYMAWEMVFFNLQIFAFAWMFWAIKDGIKDNMKWIYIGVAGGLALLTLIFAIVTMTQDGANDGKYQCGVIGIAFVAIGMAVWTASIMPNIQRTAKNIINIVTASAFFLGFILCIVGASIDGEKVGFFAAATTTALFFTILMVKFHLWDGEIAKQPILHYVLFGCEEVLALLTIIFGIVGASNVPSGSGNLHAAAILLNVAWIFTGLLLAGLSFMVLYNTVMTKPEEKNPDTTPKGKGMGFYIWLAAEACVGLAALLNFVAFCCSFY